jgi:outer membrane protein OmpA-like peptidoglycan-associated protein
MHHLVTIAFALMALAGPDANEFVLQNSKDAKTPPGTKAAAGAHASKITPTKTEAAVKFFVIEKDKGPVKGVVICLGSPAGAKYYTEETDAEGYAEVLVPVGQKYDVTYLSLGLARGDIAATVMVTDEPKQTIKLTLRYKRLPPLPPFVLTGIVFDTAKAIIKSESLPKLDVVYEFMRLKKSARVEIAGHTDNVGKPKANKTLSAKRAEACRAYLVSKGIDGSRILTVGHGGERPIVPNDSDENRQKNRRIEVVELPAPAPGATPG